jgi:hypothetical protein
MTRALFSALTLLSLCLALYRGHAALVALVLTAAACAVVAVRRWV